MSTETQRSEQAVMLTEAEAGRLCKVSAWTIKRWRQRDGLPFVRIGNTVRYPVDRLREWANTKAASKEQR